MAWDFASIHWHLVILYVGKLFLNNMQHEISNVLIHQIKKEISDVCIYRGLSYVQRHARDMTLSESGRKIIVF